MAFIKKTRENTYQIVVSNGYKTDGTKIRAKKTVELSPDLTIKQQDAEIKRIAYEFENEVKLGKLASSNMTLAKYAERWIVDHAEKHLERTTLRSYKLDLRTKILPSLGHIKLCELKPLHIIKFLENLTEEGVRYDGRTGCYSNKTIKYQLTILSSMLSTAVYWQLIERNPAHGITPPKAQKPPKKRENTYFDEIQLNIFLEFILNEPPRYRLMVLVMLFGGLRLGEALGIKWSDVDFKNSTINIENSMAYVDGEMFLKDTKTEESARKLKMPIVLMTQLKEYKLQADNTLVFKMHHSTPYNWLKRKIDQYNRINNNDPLPDVTIHGLRHTAATLMIAQNLDIKTVSGRIGHADPTTTLKIYSHYINSRDKAASDALEDIINIKRPGV